MENYEDFVEDSQYLTALKDRSKAYANVERYIRRLNLLSGKAPNDMAFMDLRLETKEAIRILDGKQDVCLDLIAENCVDYTDNDQYNESLDSYDTDVSGWNDLLSKESDRVHGAPTPVKAEQNSGSIAEMVSLIKDQSAQMKMQNDLIDSCVKLNTDQNVLFKASVDASIGKNNGPRPPTPSAPSFCPLNDLNDCKRWKEFIENFEYFTSSI